MNNLSGQTVSGSEPQLNFKRVKMTKVMFSEYLKEEYRSSKHPLPKNITNLRNMAINLSMVEIICDFSSIFFYVRRRSRIILAIDILNFFFVFLGLYGKLTLSYWYLAAHAMYNLSVVGGFYIYIMIDSYIVEYLKQEQLNVGQMSQFQVLVLSSLPLLGIFMMGIFSCILFMRVDSELQERRK